jgi:hypothetical protein
MANDRETRFNNSLRDALSYRRELLSQLQDKIAADDKRMHKNTPVNYGLLGDIEFDINLLEQLLHMENR